MTDPAKIVEWAKKLQSDHDRRGGASFKAELKKWNQNCSL